MKDFSCGYCGRRFSSRQALQSHLRTCRDNPDGPHSESGAVYECGNCGATFTDIHAAREHRKQCVGS